MENTVAIPNRKLMLRFISSTVTRNGKRITQKSLKDSTDRELFKIVSMFPAEFEEFCKKPVLVRFFFQTDKETGEIEAPSVAEAEQALMGDGYYNFTVVPAKGHHLCKYCHSIADGSNKDLLCEDCREIFTHTFYSEL